MVIKSKSDKDGYKVKPALQLLNQKNNDTLWWQIKDDPVRLANAISNVCRTIEERNQTFFGTNLRFMRLYSGSPQLAISLNQYSTTAGSSWSLSPNKPALSLNVIQACTDTMVNSLCEGRIKPQVLTDGGSFKLQQRAKKMNKFIYGLFLKKKVHEVTTAAIKDAAIFGTGFVKTTASGGDVLVEKVLPTEIIVCPGDSIYGNPRTLYQTRFVARYILLETFPESEEAIMGLKGQTVEMGTGHVVSDCIRVTEAWHLPSTSMRSVGRGQANSDTDSGCHALVADSCTFFEEPYNKDHFPFSVYRHTDLPLGYYGRGVAEELLPIQAEITQLMTRSQQMLKLIANPRIFLEEGSQVNEAHLNSQIGAIIKYRGTPPIISTPQAVPPEIYAQIDRLYNRAFEIQGVPLLQATGKKPAGVDSGKALREYADQANTRFITLTQKREQLHIDIAQLCFEACKTLAEEYGSQYKVVSYDQKDGMEVLKYSDVSMKADQYIVQVWPTNFLSKTPSSRLQEVQELTQAGLIPLQAAQDLMDFPDLAEYTELAVSGYRLARKNIEKMLETGEYMPPEETDDIQSAIKLTIQYIARQKLNSDAEEPIELLRRYLEDLQSIVSSAAPPQAPQAGPQATPEAPPVSDLLPTMPNADMSMPPSMPPI
jgi:hypothetical protein